MKKKWFALFLIFSMVSSSWFIVSGKTQSEIDGHVYYLDVEVSPGENLWNIASRYKPGFMGTEEYVKTVVRFNRLRTGSIQAGDILILPIWADDSGQMGY